MGGWDKRKESTEDGEAAKTRVEDADGWTGVAGLAGLSADAHLADGFEDLAVVSREG